ncbi:FecR family protein [Phenylobacterium sp.]|uniref:FecR family protein n=1 Tax=Phenylobacterium sp. TaxID=1871053 RepID=UPI002CC459A4|nr:FecR domain-containing protein [Phenylobacterium sp.]HLZ77235.1 FecR domain-containing protein [Phenylobacterium sp.]
MVRPEPFNDVYEEAAAWVLRLAEGEADPGLRAAFEAWRDEDPAHAQAFSDAQASWDLLGQHAAAPELLTRRRDALDRARRTGRRRWAGSPNRRALAAGLVGLIAAPIAAVGWLRVRSPAPTFFRTGHGEQRTIVLSDGSRLSLDARTTVKVTFTRDLRSVELLAGRANFEVAKDLARPMKVRAGARTVTALGTVFSVEQQPHAVVVTLLEGRVAVTGRGAIPVEMSSHQQLTVPDTGDARLREIDAEDALAWREGKLVFDDEPLAGAAARMNNYGAPELVVEGPAGALRVSGVFRAGDTDAFVDAVQSYFPVTVQRSDSVITIRLRENVRRL